MEEATLMDTRPIGVYDSGVGGLTGLRALMRLLPGEDFVYFSDSGRMPYGPRPLGELRRIAVQDMDFLAGFGVKAVLAACGTISSAAREELAAYPIPAFGVLTPALDAMAAVPGDGPLAVLATAASIESGEFTEALREKCGMKREIVGIPCPELAPTIEAGHIRADDPVVIDCIHRALAPIRGRRFDAVLLGSTHYGFIGDAIRDCLGEGVRLLSAAECGAQALRDYLAARDLTGGGRGERRFFVSGDVRAFETFARPYLQSGPVHAEQAPIMEL